jgi:arylsulfatase A-like enzyme
MTPRYYQSIVSLFLGALGVLGVLCSSPVAADEPGKPNLVVILTDDMGYGDLSCQGHPLIRTPYLDRLAAEGQRWTSFYASAPLCNPSRVAMMTGRMPIRIHRSDKNRWQHLPQDEITLAEMLKQAGYATAYVGKWGITNFTQPDGGAHPNDEGFDHFYGLVGSNDAPLRKGFARTYENIKNAVSEDFPISLYRQRKAIETPVHQPTLTKRYTEESVAWIRERPEGEPFFLFLGHSMPHVPIYASDEFRGKSRAGLYGDVIEEIDWSVGEIVEALEEAGVAEDTLVLFTSDNGPWLTYYDLGGSPGPLRDGKITAWEGGVRVPGIFWWPGRIEPALIDGIGCNVDLMATVATLAGINLPEDRVFDSIDLSPTLLSEEPSPRREWFYYGQPGNLWAYRLGDHKLVFESWESLGTEGERGWRGYDNRQQHDPPLLFDLTTDISERRDIAAERPEVVEAIRKAISRHEESLSATQP